MVPGLPRLSSSFSIASHSLAAFAGRSFWCLTSSGPWHLTHSADGVTAAHVNLAADHPWTCHHSPFRVLRTSPMPSQPAFVSASQLGSTSTAVCCASSASNSGPADIGRGSFCAACSYRGRYTRHRPSEADIARERKLLQLRVIHLCARFGISQDRMWNLDETAVRLVPAGERGWTKKSRVSPCLRLASLRRGRTCWKHERRHVDADCP